MILCCRLVVNSFLPLETVCKGSVCLYSQLLNSKFVASPERRIIDCLLFSLYGPSFQFVTDSVQTQLASLPNSIVLRLSMCCIPHTTCTVLGCSLAWVDDKWCQQDYFIGYLPVSLLSDISSTITKCLSLFGMTTRDCYVITSCCSKSFGSNSQVTSSPFISHQSVCIEDIYDNIMALLAEAFMTNDHISAPSDHSNLGSIFLTDSLQRAHSLIEFLNNSLTFPLDTNSTFLQLECICWENLISIRTSLARSVVMPLSSFPHSFFLSFFIDLFTCIHSF